MHRIGLRVLRKNSGSVDADVDLWQMNRGLPGNYAPARVSSTLTSRQVQSLGRGSRFLRPFPAPFASHGADRSASSPPFPRVKVIHFGTL